MKIRLLLRALVVALLLALFAFPAVAVETYKVDDSGSQVQGSSNLRMKWDDSVPRAGARSTVSGETTVLVRLNLSQWRGRQGRIYMALPALSSGPVTATWTTRGTLLPGALRAGERALVYAGPVQAVMLEDTLRLLIQTDGQRLARTEQLDFSFEIDVESP